MFRSDEIEGFVVNSGACIIYEIPHWMGHMKRYLLQINCISVNILMRNWFHKRGAFVWFPEIKIASNTNIHAESDASHTFWCTLFAYCAIYERKIDFTNNKHFRLILEPTKLFKAFSLWATWLWIVESGAAHWNSRTFADDNSGKLVVNSSNCKKKMYQSVIFILTEQLFRFLN